MAPTAPAPLCTLILPSGKRCGAPALRGKPFCYHHTGNHRDHTRDRLLSRRLDRLRARLDSMNAARLLETLDQQLGTLPKTLSRFPEVAYTVFYTTTRLREITSLESTLNLFLQHNQQFAEQYRASRAGSTSPSHVPSNQ